MASSICDTALAYEEQKCKNTGAFLSGGKNLPNGTDINDIHGIIVADEAGKVVLDVGVLPGLRERAVMERIGLVRPHAGDKSRLVILDVVQDGVCGRNHVCQAYSFVCPKKEQKPETVLTQRLISACFNLAIAPARNLNIKVDNILILLVRV